MGVMLDSRFHLKGWAACRCEAIKKKKNCWSVFVFCVGSILTLIMSPYEGKSLVI